MAFLLLRLRWLLFQGCKGRRKKCKKDSELGEVASDCANSNSIWNARTRLNEFTWTPVCFVGKQAIYNFFFFEETGHSQILKAKRKNWSQRAHLRVLLFKKWTEQQNTPPPPSKWYTTSAQYFLVATRGLSISETQNPKFSYEFFQNEFCSNSNEFELGNYFRTKDFVFILVLEKGFRACFHGGKGPACP